MKKIAFVISVYVAALLWPRRHQVPPTALSRGIPLRDGVVVRPEWMPHVVQGCVTWEWFLTVERERTDGRPRRLATIRRRGRSEWEAVRLHLDDVRN